MRAPAIVLAALALAACSSSAPPQPEPAYPPVTAAPPPRPAPPPVAALEPVRDQCGADSLQSLVGRPRSEIPVPLAPDRQRVACTTCPMTQDYRPDRLNFLFDADSGVIRKISCG